MEVVPAVLMAALLAVFGGVVLFYSWPLISAAWRGDFVYSPEFSGSGYILRRFIYIHVYGVEVDVCGERRAGYGYFFGSTPERPSVALRGGRLYAGSTPLLGLYVAEQNLGMELRELVVVNYTLHIGGRPARDGEAVYGGPFRLEAADVKTEVKICRGGEGVRVEVKDGSGLASGASYALEGHIVRIYHVNLAVR